MTSSGRTFAVNYSRDGDLFFKNARLAPRWTLVVAALVAVVVARRRRRRRARTFQRQSCVGCSAGTGWSITASLRSLCLRFFVASAWPWFRVWCFESFFALFGLIGSNFYFAFGLNKLFLRRGSLERLLNFESESPAVRDHRGIEIVGPPRSGRAHRRMAVRALRSCFRRSAASEWPASSLGKPPATSLGLTPSRVCGINHLERSKSILGGSGCARP